MSELNRRKFLTYVGTGAAALTVASAGIGGLAPKVEAKGRDAANNLFGFNKKVSGLNFKPIQPSDVDDIVLPKGYKYEVVAAYGDKINKVGEEFGFNCDFTEFFPIDGSSNHGLLWVNHEYSSDLFVQGAPDANGKYTAKQIEQMLKVQGGSIIEVKGDKKGGWKMVSDSTIARRVSGITPFELTGPAKVIASPNQKHGLQHYAQGTFANCSGGKTLWNTVLSAEENYEDTCEAAGLDEKHYGWIVEVDPFDPAFQVRKHTALGRFHHENAAMGLSKKGKVVVYMGDDVKDACVYKFVSEDPYVESAGRANSKLLEKGTLFVANMKKGQWVPMTYKAIEPVIKGKADLEAKYKSDADVLVYADEASLLLGGTPTDRPEDVEISPFDNTIFIAHTNNDKHGNFHGHITRFIEDNNDLGSETFDFEIFAAGGKQSGFSAPDNLTFDSNANLWTVTDISSSSLNKGIHKHFKNNGLFVIPTVAYKNVKEDEVGEAFQFASGPVEAEMTGPCFTPDETTLFLAVQHPGEGTADASKPTSLWPHRKGDTMPRPSVVAITGF